MSFPRYPEYKDGGVEWLGEVPAHWQALRLRSLCGEPIKNGVGEASDQDDPSNPRYIRITDISDSRHLRGDTFKSLPPEIAAGAPLKVGDILFAAVGATYGKSYLHQHDIGPACFAGYLVKFTPARNISSDYVAYWAESAQYWAQVNSRVIQSTVQNFSASRFRELIAPVPPLDEQVSIGHFLDRETARIDDLICDQEKLIDLLKEKRQAVISHAVTKGLDPNVPLKDSGIEWLGEVPAHWEVRSLKHFWTVTDCKHITAEFVDDGIPLASIRESQSRYVALDDAKRTTAEYYEQLIEGGRKPAPGDLVFTRNATVGEVAQVAEWHPPFALGQDVCLLRRLEPAASADFMQAVLQSGLARTQLDLAMIGSTFKRINVEEIRGLVVPYPPHEEQSQIAAHVGAAIAEIDRLVGLAEAGTLLLSERRSALISAAVTGKIDVR